MWRRGLSWLLLAVGVALVVASGAQVGYMLWQQHQLRQAWMPSTGAAQGPSPRGLRLEIPSIGLDDAVVRGTSYRDLLIAPGLLEGSPLPSAGGNTVIAAHRDTFFRHVSELQPGAAVWLHQGGRLFFYRVSTRSILSSDATGVLANTPPDRLTLVTCYPTYWIGPAPDRLVVVATRAH